MSILGAFAPKGAAAAVAALVILTGGTGCSDSPPSAPTPTPSTPVKVAGSVVATAGSSNETDVVVPPEIAASWAALGGRGSGVELVQVGGDAQTTTVPVELTGDSGARVAALGEQLNAADASAPGRSALAGLNRVKSPARAPVWVFSPLLDTRPPLDFTELAFDESPGTVVKSVRKAGRLPKLKGREVTFVVTPVAGEQQKLSALQVGYQLGGAGSGG